MREVEKGWTAPRSENRPAGRSISVASLTPAQQSHNASRRRGSHRSGAKLLLCRCVVGALAARKVAGAAKLLFVDEACVMNGLAMCASAGLFRGSSGHRRILSCGGTAGRVRWRFPKLRELLEQFINPFLYSRSVVRVIPHLTVTEMIRGPDSVNRQNSKYRIAEKR
jgi:hypothetical protein